MERLPAQPKEYLIYLDDIVIFSETFDRHSDRLDAVFEWLHSHNLKLKASKNSEYDSKPGHFSKGKVTYLGHVESRLILRSYRS